MLYFIRFPLWPVSSEWLIGAVGSLVALAGVIFTVWMLVDCLKRSSDSFVNPLTKDGQYDRLLWAVAMVVSLSFYFLGAILYFFMVFLRQKPEEK